ncbi:MAG TPA: DoxX family protein [Catenuloplanes sp.]|jgi:uncharacterized membrane protein YphA (DoxX/SURF4 family)
MVTTSPTGSGPTSTTAGRARTAVRWALQIALAATFAGAGLAKLAGDPQMIGMFTQIGAGQWLRYLVGALELAGAIGLLIPLLTGPAAVGLVALMAGASLTNVLILRVSPALSLALLVVAGVIAWLRRAQLTLLVSRLTRRSVPPTRRTPADAGRS